MASINTSTDIVNFKNNTPELLKVIFKHNNLKKYKIVILYRNSKHLLKYFNCVNGFFP